jgi:hypothetical protein
VDGVGIEPATPHEWENSRAEAAPLPGRTRIDCLFPNGGIDVYFTTVVVVAANDSCAGVVATLPASAELVLAISQHLVAGTTIREETIVSQQAGRR